MSLLYNLKIFSCLDLKIKTFAKFFLCEVSHFKHNKQLLYYEKTTLYSYLNIPEHLSGVIFLNSSEWSLLKVPEQTKT